MNPIFRLIVWLVCDHAAFVSGCFVYIVVPFAAWYLGRRAGRKKLMGNHTFILVIRPPTAPPGIPPVIRWEIEPPKDGSSLFGG